MEERHVLRIMSVALRMGEVLVANGVSMAECLHVLRRTVQALGLDRCEVVVELNKVTLSYVPADLSGAVTVVRVVEGGAANLDRLVAVEHLVRSIEAREAGVVEAMAALDRIEASPSPYPGWLRYGAELAGVASWIVFAGGDPLSVASGLVAAALVLVVLGLGRRSRVPELFVTVAAAVVVVSVPYAAGAAGLEFRVSPAVVGGLYPLLPGGALVASVTDGLMGAPISSLARGLGAIVTAVGVALGVLGALAMVDALGVELPEVPAGPWAPWITALAAAGAMVGLAVARDVAPVSVLPLAALGAGVWTVAHLGRVSDLGDDVRLLLAAVVLGLGGRLLARLQQGVASVYTGIAVFVLVPGTTIYLAMLSFARGVTEAGVSFSVDALTASVAIAAGTTLGVALGGRLRPPLRRRRPGVVPEQR
jgi:uncharacterized membrane protein YjjP (DUF1212 family)